MVHRALELLFAEVPRGERTREIASVMLLRAAEEHKESGVFLEIADFPGEEAFLQDGEDSLDGYFGIEDPNTPNTIMTEQRISQALGEVNVLGVIDRVDQLDDGSYVVIDYKTGKPPREGYEDKEFVALRTYAALLRRELGQTPVALSLYYLRDALKLTQICTDQVASAAENKIVKTYEAISTSCATDTFDVRRSRLCDWCAFQHFCPGEAPVHLKNTRTMR